MLMKIEQDVQEMREICGTVEKKRRFVPTSAVLVIIQCCSTNQRRPLCHNRLFILPLFSTHPKLAQSSLYFWTVKTWDDWVAITKNLEFFSVWIQKSICLRDAKSGKNTFVGFGVSVLREIFIQILYLRTRDGCRKVVVLCTPIEKVI